MARDIHVKDGGVWKKTTTVHVRDSGTHEPVLCSFVKDGGVWKQTNKGPSADMSRTLTIGFDTHIKTYNTPTEPHFTQSKSVSNSARGFDAGIDFYTHSPNFGTLPSPTYLCGDCVTRTVTSAYFVDAHFGARTHWLVIDTPGGTTPNNDDVFRTWRQGTITLDRNTGYTSHGSITSAAINTSARYWRWTGTDSPHGTSGTTSFVLTVGA